MNRSWLEIFSFSLAGILRYGMILFAFLLVASCSKDRRRMLAPPDPTAMGEQQVTDESSGQDAEIPVVDQTSGSEEDAIDNSGSNSTESKKVSTPQRI